MLTRLLVPAKLVKERAALIRHLGLPLKISGRFKELLRFFEVDGGTGLVQLLGILDRDPQESVGVLGRVLRRFYITRQRGLEFVILFVGPAKIDVNLRV